MVGLQRDRLTEEAYLARENRSETKHEYIRGEVVAMAVAATFAGVSAARAARSIVEHPSARP